MTESSVCAVCLGDETDCLHLRRCRLCKKMICNECLDEVAKLYLAASDNFRVVESREGIKCPICNYAYSIGDIVEAYPPMPYGKLVLDKFIRNTGKISYYPTEVDERKKEHKLITEVGSKLMYQSSIIRFIQVHYSYITYWVEHCDDFVKSFQSRGGSSALLNETQFTLAHTITLKLEYTRSTLQLRLAGCWKNNEIYKVAANCRNRQEVENLWRTLASNLLITYDTLTALSKVIKWDTHIFAVFNGWLTSIMKIPKDIHKFQDVGLISNLTPTKQQIFATIREYFPINKNSKLYFSHLYDKLVSTPDHKTFNSLDLSTIASNNTVINMLLINAIINVYLHSGYALCQSKAQTAKMHNNYYINPMLTSKTPQLVQIPTIPIKELPLSQRCQLLREYLFLEVFMSVRLIHLKNTIKTLERDPDYQDFLKDKSTEIEVAKTCTRCPTCRTPIYKASGCNAMRCTVCGTKFIFHTGQILPQNSHSGEERTPLIRKRYNGDNVIPQPTRDLTCGDYIQLSPRNGYISGLVKLTNDILMAFKISKVFKPKIRQILTKNFPRFHDSLAGMFMLITDQKIPRMCYKLTNIFRKTAYVAHLCIDHNLPPSLVFYNFIAYVNDVQVFDINSLPMYSIKDNNIEELLERFDGICFKEKNTSVDPISDTMSNQPKNFQLEFRMIDNQHSHFGSMKNYFMVLMNAISADNKKKAHDYVHGITEDMIDNFTKCCQRFSVLTDEIRSMYFMNLQIFTDLLEAHTRNTHDANEYEIITKMFVYAVNQYYDEIVEPELVKYAAYDIFIPYPSLVPNSLLARKCDQLFWHMFNFQNQRKITFTHRNYTLNMLSLINDTPMDTFETI